MQFEKISDITKLQKGDIIVSNNWNYGHVAVALSGRDSNGKAQVIQQNYSSQLWVTVNTMSVNDYVILRPKL
jgi:surface antigen